MILFVSFFAWILTILAPCILPLLPIILAWSLENNSKKWPFVIILSLAFSIVFFSIFLKATTLFISIPNSFWAMFSGWIIIWLWIITIFPNLWKNISMKFWFDSKSNQLLNNSTHYNWFKKDILIWFSLWPVFSSCSPTYALILAIILPASFLFWIINLIFYALGLSLMLIIISIFWQKAVIKLKILANPKSNFKKVLWIIFLIVGITIFTWYDKKIEWYLIENWYYIDISEFEWNILNKK